MIKPVASLSARGILGFYRGLNEYDYKYEQHINNKYQTPRPYLYSAKIVNGFVGSIFYLIPCFLIISVPAEIYRLEVNLRGMESEKKTDRYNEVI